MAFSTPKSTPLQVSTKFSWHVCFVVVLLFTGWLNQPIWKKSKSQNGWTSSPRIGVKKSKNVWVATVFHGRPPCCSPPPWCCAKRWRTTQATWTRCELGSQLCWNLVSWRLPKMPPIISGSLPEMKWPNNFPMCTKTASKRHRPLTKHKTTDREVDISEIMVGQPTLPPRTPRRNNGLIASLMKGNQWLRSPE